MKKVIGVGSDIRRRAIKNLLKAQEQIAESGSAKENISMIRALFKLSKEFEEEYQPIEECNIQEGWIATKNITSPQKWTVSFEIYDNDWCLLQKTEFWKQFENFLTETQNKNSRMSQQEKKDLPGEEWFSPIHDRFLC